MLCKYLWQIQVLFFQTFWNFFFSQMVLIHGWLNSWMQKTDSTFSLSPPTSTGKISSVQSLSRVRLLATPLTAARQACLLIINSQSLLKFMSIKSVMPPSHLILCRPLLLLPLIPLSIRGFSKGSYLCMCTNLYVRSRRWCSWMPAQPCSWVSLRSESECCPLEVLWCSALQPWGGCSSTLGQRSCSRSSVLHLIQRGE